MTTFTVPMLLNTSSLYGQILETVASQNAPRQMEISLRELLLSFYTPLSKEKRLGVVLIVLYLIMILSSMKLNLDGAETTSLAVITIILLTVPLVCVFLLRQMIVRTVREGVKHSVTIDKISMHEMGRYMLSADGGKLLLSMSYQRYRQTDFFIGQTLEVLLNEKSSTALILTRPLNDLPSSNTFDYGTSFTAVHVLLKAHSRLHERVLKTIASQNAPRQINIGIREALLSRWASLPKAERIIIATGLLLLLTYIAVAIMPLSVKLGLVLSLIILSPLLAMSLIIGLLLKWEIAQIVRNGEKRSITIDGIRRDRIRIGLSADNGKVQLYCPSVWFQQQTDFFVGQTLDVLLDIKSSKALILAESPNKLLRSKPLGYYGATFFTVPILPSTSNLHKRILKTAASQNAPRRINVGTCEILLAQASLLKEPLTIVAIILVSVSVYLCSINFSSLLGEYIAYLLLIACLISGFSLKQRVARTARDGVRHSVVIEKIRMETDGKYVLSADKGKLSLSMSYCRYRQTDFFIGQTLDVLLNAKSSTALILGDASQQPSPFKGI